MSEIIAAGLLRQERNTVANRLERSRLDKLVSQLGVPYTRLNDLATFILSRDVVDIWRLGTTDNRRVVEYIRRNWSTLSKRYEKERYGKK